jgi:hypothetical protein
MIGTDNKEDGTMENKLSSKVHDTFSKSETFNIIDRIIKQEMALKNSYIEKNGYGNGKDIALDRFDTRISAFSELYRVFGHAKEDC